LLTAVFGTKRRRGFGMSGLDAVDGSSTGT